jgi:hypothetical protein
MKGNGIRMDVISAVEERSEITRCKPEPFTEERLDVLIRSLPPPFAGGYLPS